MKTMKQTYKLSHPFEVSLGSYGGNQMWFKNKYMLKTGCGPVALTNLYAWFKGLSLSRDDFEGLQNLTSKYLKGPVVMPQQFILGARRLFRQESYQLNPIHLTLLQTNPKTWNQGLAFIATSLESDNPVALLIGPNRPKASYHRDFSNHWVLITAMTLSKDKDEVRLTVSSWGAVYHLDLKALLDSKFFLSLVSLRIKKSSTKEPSIALV